MAMLYAWMLELSLQELWVYMFQISNYECMLLLILYRGLCM